MRCKQSGAFLNVNNFELVLECLLLHFVELFQSRVESSLKGIVGWYRVFINKFMCPN